MKKLIKLLIKLFFLHLCPPILKPVKLKSIYNDIFYKKETKHHFEFEKEFLNRHAFINKAISKYDNCKYLEIGVGGGDVFNSIPLSLENKFGIDPDPYKSGNYKITSDEFFKKNSSLNFDVIFIDGLHEYKQCQRDCLNSINQLKKGGIIFFHDFLPRSFFEEKVPRRQILWTGDVWKVGVELANSSNLDFKIINIDHGIGILKVKENFKYKKLENLENEGFQEFLKYKNSLPIISTKEALDFIDN